MISKMFFSLMFIVSFYPSSLSSKLPGISFFYDVGVPLYDNISECQTALNDFAESSSNFTYCTITHSHPIHACELCVDPYMDFVSAHQNILTLQVNRTKCKDTLINLDRLEIIETTYDNIKSLWSRGYCDKCFDWIDGKPTLSNKTRTYIEYFESANKCIDDHRKDDIHGNNTEKICKDCMSKYLTLNTFYESLKGSNGETLGICMDIVDSMNATRSTWSEVLNCCKLRRTPELIFLCCSGIISALPVLFYLSAKIFCKNSTKPKILNQNSLVETMHCPPSTSSYAS